MTHPQAQSAPGWTPVQDRTRPVLAVEVVGIALGLVGFLAMMAYFLKVAPFGNTSMAAMLALVPLAMVVLAVVWIDRWEREPLPALLFAFAWGAGVSVVIALILNTQIGEMLNARLNEMDALITTTAVVAPLVEEFAKGLGVLLIFLLLPKYFDGVVDGIVYSALVAGGFAFTENILYFIQYWDQVGDTFVARGLMSPFAHVSFTFMIGIALGVAGRTRTRIAWLWLLPLGYLMAVLMHALWNYSSFSMYFDKLYWFLQIPILLVLTAVVYFLRRRESRLIRQRSAEFAAAGWMSPREVHMLGSFQERARALAWARSIGRASAMRDMQRTATRLAYNRERAASGRVQASDFEDQGRLLQELTAQRTALYGSPVA